MQYVLDEPVGLLPAQNLLFTDVPSTCTHLSVFPTFNAPTSIVDCPDSVKNEKQWFG